MPKLLLSAISRSATGRRASAVVRITLPVAGWLMQSNGSFKTAASFEEAMQNARHHADQTNDTTLLNVAAAGARPATSHEGLSPWWVAGSARSSDLRFDWPAGHGTRAYSLPAPLDHSGAGARQAMHCGGEAARSVTSSGRPGDCTLICTAAWWKAVGELEMGLDLAASASPVEWLERMEDRLLDPEVAFAGTGRGLDRYAALALWIGELRNEA